jgi:proliferating cell nuclear antigen
MIIIVNIHMFKNKIFYLHSQRPAPLKTLFEALHHVIPEASFRITNKKEDSSGTIEMSAYDSSLGVYVILCLKGHSFESFYCKYETYDIGIDIGALHLNLKSMDTSELTLSIEDSSKQMLNINFDDVAKNKKSKTKLKLLELEYNDRKKQTKNFSVNIKMNCLEFNRICKELSSLSEYVEIKCTATQLIFTAIGDKAEREVVYGSDNGSIKINWNVDELKLIQGYYELKNIVLFNKFNTMNEDVTIFLKNDFIMTIDFIIGTHGNLLVSISPINEEVIKNSNYAYSDDEDEIYIKMDEDDNIEKPTNIKKESSKIK